MSRRRFYAPPNAFSDAAVTLPPDETHHLTHVLRLTPGDEVYVFDGVGREYRCNFRGIRDNIATLEIAEQLDDQVESPVQITLVQALARGEKFDLIVQKATELGVSCIAPLITRYSDVRLDDQQRVKRVERWRRISLEAMKQCGRRQLVDIRPPRSIREFVAATDPRPNSAADNDSSVLSLVFSEGGGIPIEAALAGVPSERAILAFVGPEGGWSDDEMDVLTEFGAKAVTLGPRVLRTETAAIVVVALIQHLRGNLSSTEC
jgi:16S rRNA (uracil1498-N3)-methyltransferase